MGWVTSRWRAYASGVLATLLAITAVVACARAHAPPDVILVVLDTARADALSLYGNPRPTSPVLDAFAERSVVFDSAFTVAPSTAPAMAALMSGRLPHYDRRLSWSNEVAHGMLRFFPDGKGIGLSPALTTLSERFREAGYHTVGVVTNPYVKRVYSFDQGFDVYREIFRNDVHAYGLAEQVVDLAHAALEAAPGGVPLFVYLHFMDAHDPYLPPPVHRARFDFERLPGVDDLALNRAWLREARPAGERGLAMGRHARGLYDASVHYADAQIGRLLEGLTARREMDTALIAVVGDHGEEFLEHGGNRHRGTVYDELLRIPLLLRVPGVAPGRVGALVRHFDVGATLLDYAGLPALPETEAVSLRPFLERRDDAPELVALGSFPIMSAALPHRWYLRDAHHKLVYDVRRPERSRLYDLTADPEEREDVYSKRPEVTPRLLASVRETQARLEREWTTALTPRRRALRVDSADAFERLAWGEGSRLVVPEEPPATLRAKGGGAAEIVLPLHLFAEPARIRLELDAEAAAPAVLHVRWRDARGQGMPWRRVTRPLVAGRHVATLELSPDDLVGALRLAVEPGPVDIYSIELFDLSAPDVGPDVYEARPSSGIDADTIDQLRALGYTE